MAPRKLILTISVLILLAGTFYIATQFLGADYAGWVTGLAPEEYGCSLVAYDPQNNRQKLILALPGVAPDNYGAVSPNGKYAAYTQWNPTGTVRYLVIQKLTGFKKMKVYFKEVSGMQEVKYLSWFPDSKRLLFVKNDTTDSFPYQEVCIFDVASEKITILDTGSIWDGRSLESSNGTQAYVNYMTQDQLDRLTAKYGGGNGVSLEEVGRKLWVEFSAPSISPGGEKVAYSATLTANSADDSRKNRLASGIWVSEINGGGPHKVYSSNDQSFTIESVTWTYSGNNLVLAQCRETGGEESKIDCLNLSTSNIKTVVHSTVKYFSNFGLLAMPDNTISFLSTPKFVNRKEASRFTVSPETGEIRPQEINISSADRQLVNFSSLY